VLQVARSAADAAWWAAGATIALAVLAVVTAIMAVLAYRSQNKQLQNLETQAAEQHAVNIRQIEVLDAQLTELQEAPKIREREVDERRLAQEREAQKQERAEQRQAEEQQRVEEREAEERRQTEEREVREAAAQRRAQAEKVFLTEDRLDYDPAISQAERAAGTAVSPVIVAKARNDSDGPVYELALTWHKGSAPWGEFEKRSSLAPGARWSSTRALPADLPSYVDPEVYGAVLWFRDSARVWWRRRPDGSIDEIPAGNPRP
jgi:hypothetical protein